jgi:hypothetical protein
VAVAHCVVVDTNVLAVAEGLNVDASEECVLACVQLCRRIAEGQRVGVDESDAILQEYVETLKIAPSSGIAKKLASRLWRTRYDDRACRRVPITPLDHPPGSYEEVPEALRDFDTDDQKFFAVAVAEECAPQLFQALDGEWWARRVDLAACALDVQFLCVTDML